MLLAVDVGNSQTHAGVFADKELREQWRISTDPLRTSDELALIFSQLLSFAELSFSRQVSGVALSSVVPATTAAFREMVQHYFHFDPMVVEPGIKTGISVLTENPKEVGADRITNAVAAHSIAGGPVIVIDFGTATTFDAVTEAGELLGCAIAPGVTISADALFTATAQIKTVELWEVSSAIGRTTAESVRAGVVLGAASMVDGMVARLSAEFAPEAQVIATGGLAPLILNHCEVKARHEPYLTLEGLRILYERNVRN